MLEFNEDNRKPIADKQIFKSMWICHSRITSTNIKYDFSGARFAVCQTKVGLITILRNHKVDVCEKTMIPYEFSAGAFLLAPKGGIYLKIMKL